MACLKPLFALYSVRPDNKKQLKFVSSTRYYTKDNLLFDRSSGKSYSNYLEIPCGQCKDCRLSYSRFWAVRCMLEAQKYEHNYFVTLTLNDDNLVFVDPSDELVDSDVPPLATLFPPQFTKFVKDLRRYYKYHFNHEGIRFFGCGEYGDRKQRPHYHFILFNCPIPDLKLEFVRNGNCYYSSKIFEERIWADKRKHEWFSKGIVNIADCTFESCAYVARYMMKKLKGSAANFYFQHNLVPPFVRSSRRPGIGRDYYEDHKEDIYKFDSLVITGKDGKPLKVRPPRYFDRLFEVEHPDELLELKDKRLTRAKDLRLKRSQFTSLSDENYNSVLDYNHNQKYRSLIRPLD